MAELGNTLSRARRARGITLEDAERDTHVSRRYLTALENEDFSVFPAPVYARGFLRTYARYLGVNPDELLRIFPNGDIAPVVDIAPLPTVSRPPSQLINVNWVVTAIVVIFLAGAGLLLLRGGGDDPLTTPSQATNNGGTTVTGSPQSTLSSQVQLPATAGSNTVAATGKQIGPTSPGQLPDFVGADVASSRAVLTANQIRYTIIEYVDTRTAKGIVVDQTPNGGSKANGDTTVTLYVSAGASLTAGNTTQQ
ncbi:MAG: helix-turn-helix domain-containing protein [Dehalococcoidia bacterium]